MSLIELLKYAESHFGLRAPTFLWYASLLPKENRPLIPLSHAAISGADIGESGFGLTSLRMRFRVHGQNPALHKRMSVG